MKRIITTIILMLSFSYASYSQVCIADKFLDRQKSKDPKLEKRIQSVIDNFQNSQNRGIQNNNYQTVTIPVVFNIVHAGESVGEGRNIPDYRVHEQIELLNAAYSGQFGGVDTQIQFCLASKNIAGIDVSGIYRFNGELDYDLGEIIEIYGEDTECNLDYSKDSQLKSHRANFPSSLFLNIWVADLLYCEEENIQGYSSFPFTFSEDIDDLYDGVVLDYQWVGSNTSNFPVYVNSLGFTAVHEVGHWLGLFHTFQGACDGTSCSSQGDMICDTEPVKSSGITNIAGDPTACWGRNCDGSLSSAVRNFMDYQPSNRQHCFTTFTEGQKERIHDVLNLYRYSIFNQGNINFLVACGGGGVGGGGGGQCNEYRDLPIQKLLPPNVGNSTQRRKFGNRIEVNDKWLVTIDIDFDIGVGAPAPEVPDYLHIYKRVGCLYSLNQSLQIPLPSSIDININYGLTINGNEIIVSSHKTDSGYIYHYDELNDSWYLNQQIQNNSSSNVGTSTYTVGNFLFILENNPKVYNKFRIYYKNTNGYYQYHQTLSVPNFNLPSLGLCIQSSNFIKNKITISSNTFNGEYDPLELLVSKYRHGGSDFLLLGLNSNNYWVTLNYIQPVGMPSSDSVRDIEVSKDFIHVLTSTQLGHGGSPDDNINIYSYRISLNNINPFNPNNYVKQTIFNSEDDVGFDISFKNFNDQFMFVDGVDGYPLELFYNQNFGSNNSNPFWQKKISLPCHTSSLFEDDFEVFGNLLFYGNDPHIRIYNISDILEKKNYSTSFINNSNFFNKKTCTIPNNYTTFAERITIGESCEIEFNNIEKEFIAKEEITLKSGTTILRGSNVTLKVKPNACSSIISSSGRMAYNSKKINKSVKNKYEPLSLIQEESIENKIVIFPNPTSGISEVKNLTDMNVRTLEVYNLTNPSNILFKSQNLVSKQSLSLNLSRYNSGIYVVRVVLENSEVVYKKITKK